MSWPMPHAGAMGAAAAWNPGMAMTPDMSNYTHDQWTLMQQQQNWQQWSQWQQQYAQWQSQYGEKYNQQMQVMQAMGAMPPIVARAAAPPVPPPPTHQKPPPPPPHENNQPLYAHTQNPSISNPAPVPAPNKQQPSVNTGFNIANSTGNTQNWSYASTSNQQDPNQIAVNFEALKKLAEEERLFDIQFQKWEEEIKKWKLENANHPDKEAYKEYEEKFEACRVQLLERRQQMKQRRARLLGNSALADNNTVPTGNSNTSSTLPSLVETPVKTPNNFNQNHNHNSMPPQVFNQNSVQEQQHDDKPQADRYTRNDNQNADPQVRTEAFQTMQDSSASGGTDNSTFVLPLAESTAGIPGLDLVPNSEKAVKTADVIDITDDAQQKQTVQSGPDYTNISKGINNILGDEKIMNILSMMRGQGNPGGNGNAPNAPIADQGGQPGVGGPSGPYGLSGYGAPVGPTGYGGLISTPEQGVLPGQSGYGLPGPYPGPYGQNLNSYNGLACNPWDSNNGYYNNQQYGNNMPYNPQVPPRQNLQQSQAQYQYYDRNAQHVDPNMGPKPLMAIPVNPPDRASLQEMKGQNNMSDHPRGQMDNMMKKPISNNTMSMNQPPKAKWVEETLFTPSIIVEYEHKPLRLKAREFIEPVHTFDYDHKSKNEDYKKKDFEKEVDELFTRKPRRWDNDYGNEERGDRFAREPPREYERRPRDNIECDDYYSRVPPRDFAPRDMPPRDIPSRDYSPRDYPPRDEYIERRKVDAFDRRRDERYIRDRERDEFRDRERFDYRERDDHRDRERDRYRDERREEPRARSKSRDRDSRKRGRSRETTVSDISKKPKEEPKGPTRLGPQINALDTPKHVIMIDDLLETPGREMRPQKIVIILRGPPGSGKSYLAKLIRDREAEYNGAARIMSIDDYFMQEGEIEEQDPNTGKIVKKPTLKYEYDEKSEETYLNSLKRAFKRTLTDGYFNFLIYDAVNDQLKSYADVWNYARQNGFQVYVCTMELDPHICFKRNIHNRKLEDIEVICSRFFPTPAHHFQLDPTTLLQNAAIPDVDMEDATDEVIMEESQDNEVEVDFTSKWEKMDDAVKLARLDGISKPLRPSQLSMEDYLQLDDWTPNQAKPGKKTVRWADIEERRQQEKMRAIGFVVGHTDWNRMTDPTMGSSALTQTKFIERVKRN